MAYLAEASLQDHRSPKVVRAKVVLLVESHLEEGSRAASLVEVLESLVEDLVACLQNH